MHKVNSWCRLYRLPSNLKEMTGQSVSRVKTQRKHFVANGSVLNVTVQLSLSHSKMRVGCLDLVDSETTADNLRAHPLEQMHARHRRPARCDQIINQ